MKKTVYGILALLLSAFILYTSTNTGSVYGGIGGKVGRFLNQVFFFNRLTEGEVSTLTSAGAKLLGHFTLFALDGLFALGWANQCKKKTKALALALSLGLLLSIGGEVIQCFVAGRNANYLDVVLNYTGFVCVPLWRALYFSR